MRKLSPVTARPMQAVEYLGVQIDVCLDTGGIWFDGAELPKLKAATEHAYQELEQLAAPELEPEQSGPTARTCPVDGRPLRRYKFLLNSPIWLDECTVCGGIWVDDGELDAMHAYLAESHGAPAELPPAIQARVQMAERMAEHSEVVARLDSWVSAMRLLTRPLGRFPRP